MDDCFITQIKGGHLYFLGHPLSSLMSDRIYVEDKSVSAQQNSPARQCGVTLSLRAQSSTGPKENLGFRNSAVPKGSIVCCLILVTHDWNTVQLLNSVRCERS